VEQNQISYQRRGHVWWKALATQGPAWALARARIAGLHKLGILERRTPLQPWNHLALRTLLKAEIPSSCEDYCRWRRENPQPFFFTEIPLDEAETFVGQGSIRIADEVLDGKFPFFSGSRQLGFPPAWQMNPLSHSVAPSGHWSRIGELASEDIKLWWESSRFSWAFALGRAYARSRNEHYAEAFWQLFESWLAQNPPQWGIHWKCGQEASFRVMASCFAFYVLAESPSSTPQRVTHFVSAMAVHAQRIYVHIEYAQSQKNNHGLSEAAGLWTIGLLFPELEGAQAWKTLGKRVMEQEVRRQIYADGSYIQHSTNYHRVMLHDLAWALRLGQCSHQPLADDMYESVRKSLRFLYQVTDPETGWAPNYGANDGALVLPLSDCAYSDMRPVLQSCHYLVEGEPLYPAGPWDEEMVWLNGAAALRQRFPLEKPAPQEFDAEAGGCYTMHSAHSWLMFKGTKYEDRPSHADQLHVDLWWRGVNVFCDAGTYSYHAPAPFDHGFASTCYHNTVTVDDRDQMTRLSRFLWADWAHAHVRREAHDSLRMLDGKHDGYAKAGVTHRRRVIHAEADVWIVVDDLTGRGEHTLQLQWLMPDASFTIVSPGVVDLGLSPGKARIYLASSRESSVDMVRAGVRIAGVAAGAPDPARGWLARHYARKAPALSLAAACRTTLPLRFVTVVMLGTVREVAATPSLDSLWMDSWHIDLPAAI
jgi:Heparinase II/III-like protein/Heparinase II/III N-terminus